MIDLIKYAEERWGASKRKNKNSIAASFKYKYLDGNNKGEYVVKYDNNGELSLSLPLYYMPEIRAIIKTPNIIIIKHRCVCYWRYRNIYTKKYIIPNEKMESEIKMTRWLHEIFNLFEEELYNSSEYKEITKYVVTIIGG